MTRDRLPRRDTAPEPTETPVEPTGEGLESVAGTNVLVVNGSDDSEWVLDNCESVKPAGVRFGDLLSVTLAESAETHYETLRRRFDHARSSIGVVSVDEETRSTASQPSPPSPPVGDVWARTVAPFNLTRLGVTVHTYLDERSETADETALFVDSVGELVERADLERTFQFLHVVTGDVATTGGVGYYQIDGDHDRETIATLDPLFDAVVEVHPDGSHTVRRPVADYQPNDRESESPESTGSDSRVEPLSGLAPWLWLVAILTFGFGDIITTFVGLETGTAVEVSPAASQVIVDNGLGFLYVVKIVVFGLFYLLWRVTPQPYAVSVPLGLSLLGVGITVWNVIVLVVSITPFFDFLV